MKRIGPLLPPKMSASSAVATLLFTVVALTTLSSSLFSRVTSTPQRRYSHDGYNYAALPPRHSFSHQLVEPPRDAADDPDAPLFYAGNRDARSFWKNLFRPLVLRTRKEKKIQDENKNEKKDDRNDLRADEDSSASSSSSATKKATTFGPPAKDGGSSASSSSSSSSTTTTEHVPTAFPIPDDYEQKIQLIQSSGNNQQQSLGGQQSPYLQRPPSFGGGGSTGLIPPQAGHDPFAANPLLGAQTSPFGFSIAQAGLGGPGGGAGGIFGGAGSPHQQHRPPFGRPQSAQQQYLLKQYGSAFDGPQKQQGPHQHQHQLQMHQAQQQQQQLAQLLLMASQKGLGGSGGGGAAGNAIPNDPRLLMMLLSMSQRELTQAGNELPGVAIPISSAELRQEERALLDFLSSIGDRTGLSSFTNFDRFNLDFLNPFRNRFTLPLLNLLSGQSRPYMAVAKIYDNGAPGAPPSVASGTLTFYQKNAASPVQVEVDLQGIGSDARNVRIDIRRNIPLANCAGQGDVFNPSGRTSGGIVLTIGSSDATGRMAAVIQNLPREGVSLASPNSVIGKSVQISEAGVIHGCGTILAANALPASPLTSVV